MKKERESLSVARDDALYEVHIFAAIAATSDVCSLLPANASSEPSEFRSLHQARNTLHKQSYSQ